MRIKMPKTLFRQLLDDNSNHPSMHNLLMLLAYAPASWVLLHCPSEHLETVFCAYLTAFVVNSVVTYYGPRNPIKPPETSNDDRP